MSRDIFDDRNGFAAARHEFVTKQKPSVTPPGSPPGGAAASRAGEEGEA